MYRKEGLEPPTVVQSATHEYSEDSDKIGKFISECLVKSDQNLAAKDVNEKYSHWCNDCGLTHHFLDFIKMCSLCIQYVRVKKTTLIYIYILFAHFAHIGF